MSEEVRVVSVVRRQGEVVGGGVEDRTSEGVKVEGALGTGAGEM